MDLSGIPQHRIIPQSDETGSLTALALPASGKAREFGGDKYNYKESPSNWAPAENTDGRRLQSYLNSPPD
jgi:hypothetical protein